MSPRRSRIATSGSSWTSRSPTHVAVADSRARPRDDGTTRAIFAPDPRRRFALVDSRPEPGEGVPDLQQVSVEDLFRQALLRSHRSREFLGEVEAAAAHFCRALRQRGVAPERMLIDAKRVIEETIDGDDVLVAERAVESCIRHYYRAD